MDKKKFLTDAGIKELGRLINLSRKAKNWTLAQAASLVILPNGEKLRQESLGKIEKGYGIPEFNTLVAIAAAEFVTDASGRILSIDDFINIASECYSINQPLEFADMVAHAMQVNNISQSVLEAAFADLEPGYFEIERLRDIQAKNGEPATIAERRFIVARVDPMNSVFHRLQWFGPDSEILAKPDNSKHYTNQN